jgi:hypothetical protein
VHEFEHFFFPSLQKFFFEKAGREQSMQNEEGEGCSAPGGGGAAGKQLAHEQTDLPAAAADICEDLRRLEKQHAVSTALF